jgi:LPXTG-site transpeptidase (sortase) family protein
MNAQRPNTRWLEVGLVTAGLAMLGSWVALFALAGTDTGPRSAGETRARAAGADDQTYIGAVLYRLAGRGSAAPVAPGSQASPAPLDDVERIEFTGAGITALITGGSTRAQASTVVAGGRPSFAVLQGRKDAFYRSLGAMKPGDRIAVTTGAGRTVYRVERTAIVAPGEVRPVRRSGAQAQLMLVARYPFHAAGSAPQRFVVRAQAVAAS